eukprot:11164345-Lingulodinium_polyedra.AAC.1
MAGPRVARAGGRPDVVGRLGRAWRALQALAQRCARESIHWFLRVPVLPEGATAAFHACRVMEKQGGGP